MAAIHSLGALIGAAVVGIAATTLEATIPAANPFSPSDAIILGAILGVAASLDTNT